MYLKRIIDCVIKWCRILDSLVITIIGITTWLATIMVTIQSTIIIVPITSFTTTLTRNSIRTSSDKYRNVTIGNLVNTNNNGTISIQSYMITLEDSFRKQQLLN